MDQNNSEYDHKQGNFKIHISFQIDTEFYQKQKICV